MEAFLKFLLNIADTHEHSRDRLRPVCTLSQGLPFPETEHVNWAGYQGSVPVRSYNQAAEHVQNDAYGEMILTFTPIFFDERYSDLRSKDLDTLLAHLATLCARSIGQPDAGLWETRNGWQEHSFTNLMSWARPRTIGTRQTSRTPLVDLLGLDQRTNPRGGCPPPRRAWRRAPKRPHRFQR
jgi:GH15 family glucan-1,4-alpha-glucosidase